MLSRSTKLHLNNLSYFLSREQIIHLRTSTPPVPINGRGSPTQHTIHPPHPPYSAQQLLILYPTSFQRFIPYERFFVSIEVGPCRIGIRHQTTFRWGGGPPKEKLKNDILGVPRCCTRFRKDVNHLKPASGCVVCDFFILRHKNSTLNFFLKFIEKTSKNTTSIEGIVS